MFTYGVINTFDGKSKWLINSRASVRCLELDGVSVSMSLKPYSSERSKHLSSGAGLGDAAVTAWDGLHAQLTVAPVV